MKNSEISLKNNLSSNKQQKNKMKKIAFLGVALASLMLFSSCNKNQSDDDIPQIDGKETHSAVSISFPRTVNSRALTPGVANNVETAVNSVGVYIVDSISGYMHKGVYSSAQFTQVGDKYTLNTAIKTTTGSKSIYVVLNPNSELSANIEAQRGGIFGESPISGKAEPDFASGSDLVMASVAATRATLTEKTEVEALNSPYPISVQRNTAKVVVKEKTATIQAVGGTVDNLNYAIVVEAKKSYLIQQGGNTFATVITPARSIETLTADNEYFTKLATPGSWKNVNASTVADKDLDGYYALENVNVKNMAGNTTAAIVKARFTPTDNSVVVDYAADGTRTHGTIGAGTSFYVKKSDNSFWSEDAYASALSNGFTAAHFSKKYENGTGYYRIWVQDADGKRGVLRNNFYILNITKVTGPGLPYVPGVDPEDPTNPEDPNLPIEEDTYISVEVTVLPWDVQSSDHEI